MGVNAGSLLVSYLTSDKPPNQSEPVPPSPLKERTVAPFREGGASEITHRTFLVSTQYVVKF